MTSPTTTTANAISPLRQRMIEDMCARNLGRDSQRNHIGSCKRFAAWLGRCPSSATADEVKAFQLHLIESGASIPNRNRIMTGVKFLFRVTLRRHDLAAEIYHLREPQKVPLVMSPDEVKRLLAMAGSVKVRTMLSLSYGCGLRAGDIDSAQNIIRVVQAKGRKDRHVMLPPDVLELLRALALLGRETACTSSAALTARPRNLHRSSVPSNAQALLPNPLTLKFSWHLTYAMPK